MKNLYPLKNEKATVCVNKVCTTVEGEAARIVNIVAISLSLIALGLAIHKLLK
ncbi:MAG: hypothetical protein ACK5QC_09450 [Bacteroidota bacterium]